MTTTEGDADADGRRPAAVARADARRLRRRGAERRSRGGPRRRVDDRPAGLDWTVEQRPPVAVVEREHESLRLPVPRHVANVRSDTGAVLGVVGEGDEPLQNRQALCDGYAPTHFCRLALLASVVQPLSVLGTFHCRDRVHTNAPVVFELHTLLKEPRPRFSIRSKLAVFRERKPLADVSVLVLDEGRSPRV
jgi:hypothetical protein